MWVESCSVSRAPGSQPHNAGLTLPSPPPYHIRLATQKYRDASLHLLAQAQSELAAGDVRQASEKGWGAAAQMLKAIAEERGWEHERHRHFSRVASRLRYELGNGDLYRQFRVAEGLHANFYEDTLETEDVALDLRDVALLLDKLEPLTRP